MSVIGVSLKRDLNMAAKRGRERAVLCFSRSCILDLYRNKIYKVHIPYNRDTNISHKYYDIYSVKTQLVDLRLSYMFRLLFCSHRQADTKNEKKMEIFN